jgi:hypothetical protein
MRFAHARLRPAAGTDRKGMKEESNHIGAPLGGDCAAVSVPPLCVCLRTLSRRRAQRAPLSRVRPPSRSFCLRVSGAVAPSASEEPISPAMTLLCANFRFGPAFPICAFRIPIAHYITLSRSEVSSKGRDDATIECELIVMRLPRGLSKSRDREMVADRQGSEHQGGMTRFLAPCLSSS